MDDNKLFEILGRYCSDVYMLRKEVERLNLINESQQNIINELSQQVEILNTENMSLKITLPVGNENCC